MSRPISGVPVVRFADFELDLQSGELTRNGSRVVLAQQPFQLLVTLIREPGGVVTREHLQQELWPAGTFVDFDLGLNAAMKRLREALGDSATSPRFIETLPRRGYRFIAPVHDGSEIGATEGDPIQPASRVSGDSHTRKSPVQALKGALAVVSGGVLIALGFSGGASDERVSEPRAKISKVTNVGTVRVASLSPDGKQIVYARADGVRESLWLRTLREPNPVQLLEPVHGTFRYVTLGGDGFVYYNLLNPTLTAAALQRLSISNRSSEWLSDTGAAVGLSPDGSRFAYVSTTSMGMQESQIVVGSGDWTDTHPIAVRRAPESFVKHVKPAWSPDGTALAVLSTSESAPQHFQLLIIDARDGHVRSVRALGLVDVRGGGWLPNGDDLVVSARDRRASPRRLWRMSIATGTRRSLTHDVSDYSLAGVTRDGRTLVAVRGEVARTFWVADVTDLAVARQIAVDSGNLGGLEGIAWAPDNRLLYATAESDNVDIWSVDVRTLERRQLTTDRAEDYQPTVSADGRTVAFVSTRSGAPSIWSMSMDGTDARRLTSGDDSRPSISADGKRIAFQRDNVDTLPFRIWRVPVASGEAAPVGTHHTMRPAVSPDGKAIAHYWMTSEHWTLAVTAPEGGLPVRTFALSPTHLDRVVRWSPDGRALAFIDGAGGVSNIWIQPLDGGAARRLTNFAEGTISTFDWSRNGSMLAWTRTTEMHDVVSIDIAALDDKR